MGRAAVLLAIVAGFALSPVLAQELSGEGAIPPLLVKQVTPPYPEQLKSTGIEGTVRLKCIVREDGTTGEGRVIASVHPVLDREALRALAQWRYLPGRKDGKPVPVRVEVEISFLREPDPEPKGPRLGSPDVYTPGDGVTKPVVVRSWPAHYAPGAMRAGVQGSVKLECVVLPDGTVGDVRVLQRLYPQQDEEAVRALRRWRFRPGTKDGVAVPVRMDVEMSFVLGSGRSK